MSFLVNLNVVWVVGLDLVITELSDVVGRRPAAPLRGAPLVWKGNTEMSLRDVPMLEGHGK